ncbi:MAG TPA: hypothetical protein VIR15_09495 [Intrasporangium sp.]|uniref:hypothetical protein n=1 Tax=Intrasporangium sp. TaxID=1925024 RepID=UPI002F936C81
MTDRTEQLESWWSGLSADQRARALRGRASDTLDEDLLTSLEDTGLVRPENQQDKHEVLTFLKTRH